MFIRLYGNVCDIKRRTIVCWSSVTNMNYAFRNGLRYVLWICFYTSHIFHECRAMHFARCCCHCKRARRGPWELHADHLALPLFRCAKAITFCRRKRAHHGGALSEDLGPKDGLRKNYIAGHTDLTLADNSLQRRSHVSSDTFHRRTLAHLSHPSPQTCHV